MLPTFVIGLREGVEAALIVSIIATFLRQEGRTDALRWVWVGVSSAAAICLAVGVALQLVDQELPQKEQEGLETIVGAVAVGIVTFMLVWMRRHAAGLSGELRASTASSLKDGSVKALIGMAFFAVFREGLETAVFLLAVFQNSDDPGTAGVGAILGIVCAIGIGFAIYRGGIKLNLQRFFMRVHTYVVLMEDTYPSTDEEQYVHLDYVYPDAKNDLNRWLPLVKWFLAIPHYFVLFFLGIGAFFVTIFAWFAILFTGHYPRGAFDFVRGVQRWYVRVNAYAFTLVTDRYPPFSLDP